MQQESNQARGDARLQRLVLLEVLDPPAFGKSPRALARRLGEPEPNIEAAAATLEDKGLAIVTDNYVAASGAAIDFDALWDGVPL